VLQNGGELLLSLGNEYLIAPMAGFSSDARPRAVIPGEE
jgi:hypothetical protein